MDFYMIEKFKFLLRNGCWPISPHGIQLSLDDSEDSFDSAAEEDDEEYLSKIFHMPGYVSNLRIREASQENIKKIIIKDMPVTREYEEQSNKNAEELMEEEERERLKLERRKERKRRKRERKKAEKEANKVGNAEDDSDDDDDEKENEQRKSLKKKTEINKKDKSDTAVDGARGNEEESEDFLDVNSAFVTKLVKHKLRNNLNTSAQSKSNGNTTNGGAKGYSNSSTSPKRTANGSRILTIPPRNILLGERLAVAGYECASKEEYEQAIELFTRALRNVPSDHRYWGNRSFCYFNIGQYEKALGDAECAIRLAPLSPKGHYRKAEALAGLRDLVAAEESFQRVLELDVDCQDARQELLNIRVLRITDMGFPYKRALLALKKYTTMEDAVEALMSNEDFPSEPEEEGDEVYNSEEEEINWDEIGISGYISSQTNSSLSGEPQQQQQQIFVESVDDNAGPKVSKKHAAMDPSNPNRCVSIWVGNIEDTVSEKILNDVFSRFGQILSIRMLPSSHCAFINFKDSKAPGPAMAAMQGKELAGKNLLIRYPNKTKEEQQLHQQMVCHQKRLQTAIGACAPSAVTDTMTVTATTSAVSTASMKTTLVPSSKGTRVKLKGPVNGDECYYWRTTGCAFGEHCRNKHIKEHRGIDRKPWHK